MKTILDGNFGIWVVKKISSSVIVENIVGNGHLEFIPF